jgi:hypothetical protein
MNLKGELGVSWKVVLSIVVVVAMVVALLLLNGKGYYNVVYGSYVSNISFDGNNAVVYLSDEAKSLDSDNLSLVFSDESGEHSYTLENTEPVQVVDLESLGISDPKSISKVELRASGAAVESVEFEKQESPFVKVYPASKAAQTAKKKSSGGGGGGGGSGGGSSDGGSSGGGTTPEPQVGCSVTNTTYNFTCYNSTLLRYMDNCGGWQSEKEICANGCSEGACNSSPVQVQSINCSDSNILCVDDDNSTGDAEYLTIQSAVSAVQAGQTVLVRGGVYREVITLANNGTPNSRITIQNYPGEHPIINKSTGGTAFTMTSKSNINIKGFSIVDLQFGASYGVALSNAENITIEGNYISSERYKSGKCIKFDTYIRNLEITGNNISFIDDGISAYSVGAYFYNISIINNTIDGRTEDRPINEVHCCEGSSCTSFPGLPACPHPDGIQFERNQLIDGLRISYNNLSDGDSANLYIRSNIGDGLQIRNLVVSNNVFSHTSPGLSKDFHIDTQSDPNLLLKDAQIYSNSFVMAASEYVHGIGIGDCNETNVTLRDNLFYNAIFNRDSSFDSDYTLVYKSPTNSKSVIIQTGFYNTLSAFRTAYPGQEANSVESDPLFVDLPNSNFRPSANSPACNMSSTGSYVGALPCAA